MNHRTCTTNCHELMTLALLLLLAVAQGDTLNAADDPVETGPEKLSQALTSVLATQSRAWNKADLDGFMDHYWKSEQLTFSSGGTTTRGWQATLARYKKRYSTPEQMGRLTFDHLEFAPLGDAAALVLGQWHLQRGAENLGGNFSLVFRRIDQRWVIIHDHTSSLAP